MVPFKGTPKDAPFNLLVKAGNDPSPGGKNHFGTPLKDTKSGMVFFGSFQLIPCEPASNRVNLGWVPICLAHLSKARWI